MSFDVRSWYIWIWLDNYDCMYIFVLFFIWNVKYSCFYNVGMFFKCCFNFCRIDIYFIWDDYIFFLIIDVIEVIFIKIGDIVYGLYIILVVIYVFFMCFVISRKDICILYKEFVWFMRCCNFFFIISIKFNNNFRCWFVVRFRFW